MVSQTIRANIESKNLKKFGLIEINSSFTKKKETMALHHHIHFSVQASHE